MADSITDLLKAPNEMYDNQMYGGFVQGTVVENNNSKFPGMVKVSFTVWENGKNMIEWVQLMSPYTGKDYGTYLVPEIDETVLIGFIGGSLKRPFLLGSLYPSGSQIVKKQFDKKNVNKVLTTKGGVNIAINDADKKQSVTVTTPKEITFMLDDEKETVTMSDKDGKNKIFMDLQKGEMMICAENKMTLKVGSASVELTGSSGQIALKGNGFDVDAKQAINMEAKANAKLKGAALALEGMQTADLKASGMTQIKGGMVKIN